MTARQFPMFLREHLQRSKTNGADIEDAQKVALRNFLSCVNDKCTTIIAFFNMAQGFLRGVKGIFNDIFKYILCTYTIFTFPLKYSLYS